MEQPLQPSGQAQNVPVKKAWYKKWWVIGVGILFLYSIASNSFDEAKKKAEQNEASAESQSVQKEITNPTPQPTVQAPQYTFDIPSLFGKNIDEIRKVLGQPTNQNIEAPKDTLDKQKQLGESYVMETWDNTFKSGGFEMSVEFFIKDHSVKNFFVGANDPSGVTKNKQKLLLIGNLSENDPRYTVEFVKAKVDPSSFTGLIITPKK